MTSPLSRISAGSFFNGYMLEYSSLGCPGTTVVGTNSILSIRPSSIAAMRTLRANGEAGENVSFIDCSLNNAQICRHCELGPALRRRPALDETVRAGAARRAAAPSHYAQGQPHRSRQGLLR